MSVNPSTTGAPSTKQSLSNSSKRLLSNPILVTSINIKGLSADKENLLVNLCKENNTDILLLPETHRGATSRRPKVNGIKLILKHPHDQYGSAIFVKPDISVSSISLTYENNIMTLTIETSSCTVTSFPTFSSPTVAFTFEETSNFHSQPIKFVISDFNCHSSAWRYAETDPNGEELEHWAEKMNMTTLFPRKPFKQVKMHYKRYRRPERRGGVSL